MKVRLTLLTASLIGIVSIAGFASTALAWHPKGVISKKVENVTTGSVLGEADSADSAVAAKPGDTLTYVITVSNNGAVDASGNNDMANTVMTDTLPDGITLVANPSQRQITENLGTIKPGKSVTKEYTVTVTATADETIENQACFTGNSKANDNPQQGCNAAFVTVTVPPTPVIPVTPVTPTPTTPTPQPVMPTELPHTGIAENIIASGLILGLITYTTYFYYISRKALATKNS